MADIRHPPEYETARQFLLPGGIVCYAVRCLEHLWLVVLLCCRSALLATWTTWASVIAAWTSAVVTTAVILAWTLVTSWLALWLNVSLWLLDESSA